VPSLALAQRQAPPSPEQRIDRLEKQVQQVQRQVFPKGRPADTAGFSDDPAATQSSFITLSQRLDALERQVTDLVRQSEENGNRLRMLETGMGQLKADQDQRISALEQRMNEAATAAPAPAAETPPAVTTAPPGPSLRRPNRQLRPRPPTPLPQSAKRQPRLRQAIPARTPTARASINGRQASTTRPLQR
jgi:hypothetical protein